MNANSIILESTRLHLQPFAKPDIERLHAFWTEPGVRKYLWDDVVISREQVADIVANSIHDFVANGLGHWVITFKGESELVGWAGLRHFGAPPEVEILYGIVPQYWGRGLAVEAALTVLRYGFETLGLHRVYAGTDPPNTASVRVMEKVGMRFDRRTEINGLAAIYYVLSGEDWRHYQKTVVN